MPFGRKRQTTFDKLSAQTPSESTKFRDVHNNQQVEHSQLTGGGTMKSRLILMAILAVFVFVFVYVILSFVGFGAYTIFGSSVVQGSTSSVSSAAGSASSSVVQAAEQEGRPATSAPQDISYEDFLSGYFSKLPRDVEAGRLTDMYVDSDGKEYQEANVKALWMEIQDGKWLTEEAELWQRAEKLKSENEYGLLPWSMAPMNITYDDFLKIYFVRNTSSESFIASYFDYDGRKLLESDVSNLWREIQAGTKGSGKVSDQACIGGNQITATGGEVDTESLTLSDFMAPTRGKVLISLLFALLVWLLLLPFMIRLKQAQDTANKGIDIMQDAGDQHIATPEELQEKFDWFPDAGATCSVQVSSMISHMMLSNKGLKKINMPRRAQSDILDKDGNVLYYEGEILLDDDGQPIVDVVPLIDEAFGDALYEASGLPKDKPRTAKDKRLRKWFDATKIPYNPGNKDRDKLKGYATVADMINGDWELPEYEPQRPAGAYLVDVAPVNTMV